MISFIFKKKPIQVECFTKCHNTLEMYPIQKSFDFIPDWWKKLSKSYYSTHTSTKKPFECPTMKTCSGFLELYKNGFILPLWTDIDFFVDKNNFIYHSPYNEFKLGSHNSFEYGFNFSNYHFGKIMSPWMFREKTGIKFSWSACTWSHLMEAPPLTVLPAIIDFKCQHAVNINFFMDKVDSEFRVKAGMPLVHLLPMSDKPIKISTHLLDEVEWGKLASRMKFHKFTGGYLRTKKRFGV